MTRHAFFAITVAVSLLACADLKAQQFEAVYSLDHVRSSQIVAAMDDLFSDPDMKGSKATAYSADFGVLNGSHKLVVDFDSYDERATRDEKRLGSHGWARYQLAMRDAEFVAGDMAGVVADHGEPRHTANYLLAYLLQVDDAAAYAAAIAELNAALGNPGVLRLVALRTGSRAVTHAVLIGGDSFASVMKYMDRLYASEAFKNFASKVADIRTVVHIEAYRKIGAWGY